MTTEIVTHTPDPMLAMIERVALSPDAADKVQMIEKLLDLKERQDAHLAEKAFAEDFARMKPSLPRVIKSHDNNQTRSKYAKLEDISGVVDPVIGEFGFSTRFKTSQDEKTVTAICILQHRDGHKEETPITLPLDDSGIAGTKNKTAVHAIASSIMYAKRLAKCAALDISTGDDDGNAAGGEKAVIQFQAETLREVLMGCNDVTKEWFAKTYGTIAAVPRDKFTSVLTRLQAARDKAAKETKGFVEEIVGDAPLKDTRV